MSNNVTSPNERNQEPAAIKEISLSQAILAPLDALFKAQVHAARSFLNLLLQMGYPHVELDEKGVPLIDEKDGKGVYTQDFVFEDPEGKKMKVSIPSLSLVPVAPLTIDSANFKLNFKVENNHTHSQIQDSEKESVEKESHTEWNSTNRPWFLVKDPVGFSGNIAPAGGSRNESSDRSSSVINIEINLVRQPLPAGLDKLLTALQQSSYVKNID